MKGYRKGMLAKSKAGHDTGKIYVIIDVDKAYVYLADGKIRTLNNLKKKKKKHVQLISKRNNISAVDDVKIKRILKQYNSRKKIRNRRKHTCQKPT